VDYWDESILFEIEWPGKQKVTTQINIGLRNRCVSPSEVFGNRIKILESVVNLCPLEVVSIL